MNDQQKTDPVKKRLHQDGFEMGFVEFIALAAAMQSLTALSIDAMLPALPAIGNDLNTSHANDAQLIVLIMFLGFGLGQIIYGPISDSSGRKPPIYAGMAIYIIGCLVCITSGSLMSMLYGRFLQGFGIAGPRIVINAVIRDKFEGPEMARVISFVMAVFILVPVIAPSIGQVILIVFDWRAIFGMLLLIAVIALGWFAIRLKETLDTEQRIRFSLNTSFQAVLMVLRTRKSLGYTLAIGFVFSPFIGYLSSSQQIFSDVFGMEKEFPYLFATLALSFGAASLMNARLVMMYGMRSLSIWSALIITGLSIMFFISLLVNDSEELELWVFMCFMMTVFLCIGFLFGNLNALAMDPLGHMAGVGASVIGALYSLISIPLGIVIAQNFDRTVLPLVMGFAVCGVAVILSILWAER